MNPYENLTEEQIQAELDKVNKLIQKAENQIKLEETKIEDVDSPIIGMKDRLLVKNLASNAGQGVNYLKKKYPDAEFIAKDGEIYAKGKDETSFKPIDSSAYNFADIGDVVYDLLSGGAQAAASIAAAPTTPMGMAVAGGATNLATEALRQKLGKVFGVNEQYDPTNLIMSGTLGAAIPTAGTIVKEIASDATPALVSGAKKVADAAKRYGYGFAGFKNLEDYDTYLNNKEVVKGLAEKLKNRVGGGLAEVQKMASDKLLNIKDRLLNIGLDEDAFYNQTLKDKFVTVNLPQIEASLTGPEMAEESMALLAEANKYRPTVGGMPLPAQQGGGMAPSVITKTAFGQTLPEIKERAITELTDLPISTYAPEQIPLFMMDEVPVTKQLPEMVQTRTLPGLKLEAPESVDLPIAVQESLPLDFLKYNTDEVTIPANLARKLKQKLQKPAYAPKSNVMTARSKELDEKAAAAANEINRRMRQGELKEILKASDRKMQVGKVAQEELDRLATSTPIANLTTESADKLAFLQNASELAGDDSLLKFASELRGAQALIGAKDANMNSRVWRMIRNKLARDTLEASQALPKTVDALSRFNQKSIEKMTGLSPAYKGARIPPAVWNMMFLNSSNKGEE